MNDAPLLTPLFRRWARRVDLTEADRDAILAIPATTRAFARDSYLVREGEPTLNCSLMLTGYSYRQKLVSDGARQIISIHIPGEFVDLQNALLTVADHNVQCLSRCEVAIIPKSALLEVTDRYPNVARAMWLDTLIDSSIFREWVVNVGRRDARARISHLLCELVIRMRSAGLAPKDVCVFPLTQEQLADATGLTAVHTNRTLQALRKDGLIRLSTSQLTVLDWDGLREAGDFNERYLHHEVA